MEFIKCTAEYFPETVSFYHKIVADLKKIVNYPKWGAHHPSEEDLQSAFDSGTLYICVDNGDPSYGGSSGHEPGGECDDNERRFKAAHVIGAVVLNEEPSGNYEAAEWQRDLKRGEYLVIHLLAVATDQRGRGTGGFIVDKCLETAENGGYKAVRMDVVPTNDPAIRLYLSKGFTYAGTVDLGLNIPAIPVFALYEKNFD